MNPFTSSSPDLCPSTASPRILLPPPLMNHHRKPGRHNLIQRQPPDAPVHDMQFPLLAPRKRRVVELGQPLLLLVDQDQIRPENAVALPRERLPAKGRGDVGQGAREEARAGELGGVGADRDVDAAGPAVERGGAEDRCVGGGRGGRGGGGDAHVRFGAEDGAVVAVDLVEGVGLVHVGDGHVSGREAIAVDVESARGHVGGRGGAGGHEWSGSLRLLLGCEVLLFEGHFELN